MNKEFTGFTPDNHLKHFYMDNNKYYTPSLDEFYVGFEYQKYIPSYKDYVTITVNKVDITSIPNYYSSGVDDTCLRIKYLDQEDIESLGWIPGIANIEGKEIDCYGINNIVITSITKDHKLDISYISTIGGKSSLQRIFRGVVKNKSELKKLMKQLGINE